MMLKKPTCQARPTASRRAAVAPMALFSKKSASAATVVKQAPKGKKTSKEEKELPKQNFFSQALNALDFSEVRDKDDQRLLYEAKYGKRSKGDQMTPEQAAALRRKVRGTAKDFWKDWVEEERVEKTYYKPDEAGGTVPYLPFLVAVVLGLVAATVVVVQQTS